MLAHSLSIVHALVSFYNANRGVIDAFLLLLIVSSLQLLKRRYVIGERIAFHFFRHQIDFDYRKFIQGVLAVVSFAIAWANDYLANQPYNVTAAFGYTGLFFMLATLLHRFGVSPLESNLKLLLNYLSRRTVPLPDSGSDSAGPPSA